MRQTLYRPVLKTKHMQDDESEAFDVRVFNSHFNVYFEGRFSNILENNRQIFVPLDKNSNKMDLKQCPAGFSWKPAGNVPIYQLITLSKHFDGFIPMPRQEQEKIKEYLTQVDMYFDTMLPS